MRKNRYVAKYTAEKQKINGKSCAEEMKSIAKTKAFFTKTPIFNHVKYNLHLLDF